MKKTLAFIGSSALVLGLFSGPAQGQEKTEVPLVVKGSVAGGAQAVNEVERSSKFTEYRDVPRSLFLESLRLDLTKGNRYVYLRAFKVQQADALVQAGLGSYGTFKLDVGYEQTPHRFGYAAATPYVEPLPGVFTLNDVIRSDAEALVPTGTSTNIAAARALVSSFLTSAGPIGLGLERKKASIDLAYTPAVPWRLTVSGSSEARTGSRPYGAPLGFSNAIELPEPIHYTTTDLATSLEYHKKRGTVRAGFSASIFDNDVQTLIWDNPYRITDSTYASAYSAGNGTARGRMALPPSNNALRFFLSGSFKPLASTRISAAASYALFRQDERLQPFTINTAIPGSDPLAANALLAPRGTARARANVSSIDLTLSSRLAKSLHLSAGFRYYDFANRTESLDIPDGYARLDQVWEDVPIAVEPYSFSRTRLFGDLSYHLTSTTTVTAGYSFYRLGRHEGLAETEKNKNDEGTFKASVDSHPLDWLDVRVSYLSAKRNWSLDDTFVAYIPSFSFKRYFEASRDRQAVSAIVGLSPVDRLDVQLNYSLGRDDYPKSTYGLKRDDFDSYGIDVSYAFTKSQSAYAFYLRELYKSDQADRQSGASFSENPADDWTAFLEDKVDTFGAGHQAQLIPNKLGLDLAATYSRTKGSSLLASPPGGAPDLAVNFSKPLDTTSWWTLQASLKWRLMERLSVVLGYWYEAYDLTDIVRNDIAVDYASAGAIFLGALEPGYRYHVGSLRFVYSF